MNIQSRRLWQIVAGVCVLSALLLGACLAGPRPETPLHPVSGRLVNYRGKMVVPGLGEVSTGHPLVRTRLRFVPDESRGDLHGRQAIALTDAYGNFTLETPSKGQGADAGWYRVVVESTAGKPIPEQYLNVETTPLFVEVPEGGVEHLRLWVGKPES